MRLGRIGLLVLALLLASCETGTEPRKEAPPESRTGWILGRDHQPKQIWFRVVNGQAVWQGDIRLGDASKIPSTREQLSRRANYGLASAPGYGTRWPDGVIPYSILMQDDGKIADAIAEIDATYTALTFVQRTEEEAWIRFYQTFGDPSSDCIGYEGGVCTVEVNLSLPVGSVIHEILHALGLGHEQNRCDRDTYVQINWNNIDDAAEDQYIKECDADFEDIIVYDESSVMHYGRNQGSVGFPTYPTMTSLRGRDSDMGQRNGLSSGDILSLQYMYPMPNVYITGSVDVQPYPWCYNTYYANVPGVSNIASYSWSSSGQVNAGNSAYAVIDAFPPGGNWVQLTVTLHSGLQIPAYLEVISSYSGSDCWS